MSVHALNHSIDKADNRKELEARLSSLMRTRSYREALHLAAQLLDQPDPNPFVFASAARCLAMTKSREAAIDFLGKCKTAYSRFSPNVQRSRERMIEKLNNSTVPIDEVFWFLSLSIEEMKAMLDQMNDVMDIFQQERYMACLNKLFRERQYAYVIDRAQFMLKHVLSGELYGFLARCYFAQGQYRAAEVAARFSAQLCDDTGGYSYLAKVLMAKGKLRQAERAVALALEPHRNPDAISWATCARLFVMLKQWDEARQAAERSLSYGRNVISLSMLAGIYIGLGDLPKAKEFLVEGRAMAPEDKILNVQYASVLINEGDYSRASDILTFLENQYPTDPWLIGLRSKICFATGDWEGAKTLAMASFKRNPTRQALTATIHAFVNLHDEIGMTEWLLRVMNSDPIRHESLDTLEIVAPFSADIYAFLVRFFLTQGKLGMAEWFAQEMYKYYRESEVRSYIFMAMVIAALNQPFRLEELTIEGLKQFSGNQALRGLYLEALRKQKRYDEVLEIGGRFTFDHISVPLCLAYSAMESKQYEQAYEFLLEAEKLVDGEAETYFDSRLRLYGCYLYIYDNMARAGLFPTTIRGLPEAVQTAVEQLRAFPREKVGRSQEHHYRSMQRIIDQYQW